MPKQVIIGDMLTGVDKGIIVHGCNAVGVMGSGIAKLIKDKWPEVFMSYARHCMDIEHRIDRLGTVDFVQVSDNLYIANAITQEIYAGYQGQRHSGPYVSYDAVSRCFNKIGKFAKDHGLMVNYPLIGAGLAQGNWDIISERIDKALPDDIFHVLWKLP